jgi:hypothetical protein
MVRLGGLLLEADPVASKPIRLERSITPEYVRDQAYQSLDRYKSEKAYFEPVALKRVEESLESASFLVMHLGTQQGSASDLTYKINGGLGEVRENVNNNINKDFALGIITRDVGRLFLASRYEEIPSKVMQRNSADLQRLKRIIEKIGVTGDDAEFLMRTFDRLPGYGQEELGIADFMADFVLRDRKNTLHDLRYGGKLGYTERNVHHSYLRLEREHGPEKAMNRAVFLELPTIVTAPQRPGTLFEFEASFLGPLYAALGAVSAVVDVDFGRIFAELENKTFNTIDSIGWPTKGFLVAGLGITIAGIITTHKKREEFKKSLGLI